MTHASTTRLALTDVRVFDGEGLRPPATVVVDGPVIGSDPAGAEVLDCGGAVLVPGFFDAHVHVDGRERLVELRANGVTTALDMGTPSPPALDALRGLPGLTDLRSAGIPAMSPANPVTRVLGLPGELFTEVDAAAFVAARFADGADYLKILVEGHDEEAFGQDRVDALVAAAHERGKLVVAHAPAHDAVVVALRAGVDVLTHVPLDRPIDADLAALAAERGVVVVPTLTIMLAVATSAGLDYGVARDSVTALHRAGVPVLAGTDANAVPGSPANVAFGHTLHGELELLVEAGLSTVDALRAATSLPAKHFGLTDRGAITPGLRADLVLLAENPLSDIRATRTIRHTWCAGTQHPN